MTTSVDLTVDVSSAVSLGEPLHTVATVHLPEPDRLADPPVVCFGFPGGGYSRHYYSIDLIGDGISQAEWHVARGWIFVTCDHLGVGDSSVLEPDTLTYETVAAANVMTVESVLAALAGHTLDDGFPAVTDPVTLGVGQSMGGCFLIVAQADHDPFDGIALLGFSGIHTVVPSPPGAPEVAIARISEEDRGQAFTWAFHHEDEPGDIVDRDMAAMAGGEVPPWRSPTVPACAIQMIEPGTVATEAASISIPILIAVGERDVVPDPWQEPTAFRSSSDISVYVCERMAHMHNFAPTRERFWERIHSWGNGVAAST